MIGMILYHPARNVEKRNSVRTVINQTSRRWSLSRLAGNLREVEEIFIGLRKEM